MTWPSIEQCLISYDIGGFGRVVYANYMPIHIDTTKDRICDFIEDNPVGVLATVDKAGAPHAATVYFVTDSDLNIYFVTKEGTQKHKNLQHNPHAAIAIHHAQSQTTVQAQGKAEVIDDIKEFMDLFHQILDASLRTGESERPPVSKLFAGDYFMYKFTSNELRLAEYTKPDHGDLGSIFEVAKQ